MEVKVCGGRRFAGVGTASTVDLVDFFGAIVVGGEGVIIDRPGGGIACGVRSGGEVLGAHSQECAAVYFGVAADAVVGVGADGFAAIVVPDFGGLVESLLVDFFGVPVVGFSGDGGAAIEHEDGGVGGSEGVGEGAAACSGADNDVVVVGHFGCGLVLGC